MLRTLSLLVLGSAMTLTGADFWQQKDAQSWNTAEANKLMSRSPWSRQVTVEFHMRGPGGPSGRMGRGGGGGMGAASGSMGGPSGGGGVEGGPGGGGGMGGGGMGRGGDLVPGSDRPQMIATVRWESAEPVRLAAQKLEHPGVQQIAEWSKEFYIVSVSGIMPMAGRGLGGGPGGGGGPRRPEGAGGPGSGGPGQMRQRLVEATSLKVKGKDPMHPERVEMVETPGGRMLLFFFPRSQAIESGAKDISFETAMGPMEIRTKFGLKDMAYRGSPAL